MEQGRDFGETQLKQSGACLMFDDSGLMLEYAPNLGLFSGPPGLKPRPEINIQQAHRCDESLRVCSKLLPVTMIRRHWCRCSQASR